MLADPDRYTVNISGHYRHCRNGILYVMADTLEQAAHKIPQATMIEEVGVAHDDCN